MKNIYLLKQNGEILELILTLDRYKELQDCGTVIFGGKRFNYNPNMMKDHIVYCETSGDFAAAKSEVVRVDQPKVT